MEVKGGIGRGRKSRHQRCQDQRHDLPAAPQSNARTRRAIGRGKQARHADLHQRDEPERCRKRHLEARMDQRFRRNHQHDQRRHCQGSERDGPPIDHDGDQHHGGHEKRTLGRNFGARQQQIEGGRDQRRRRGPFLDRRTDGETRDQRQQRADGKEHNAGNDRHVVAGDRQHMAEAGDEHRIIDRLGDGIAPPGQQRRCDGTLVAIERRSYPRIDRIAQPLHDGRITQGEPAVDPRLDGFDRAHGKTGRPDALKIKIAREIVAAGPQWRQRRLQSCFQFDEAADLRRRAFPDRQPNTFELDLPARAFHLCYPQHKAIGALADIPRLDKAGQRYRISRPCQHGVRKMRGS